MGIKETSDACHASRNTVRKYVRLFLSSGKSIDQLLSLSDEQLHELFGCGESRRREPSPRKVEGKSFLAYALGHEACIRGFRTFYANAPKLLGALKVAKIKGTL